MALRNRPEYDLKVIGRNLRRLRKEHHYTAEEIRDFLQLGSVQAVYKYERGLSYPQTDAMFALMELYDVGLKDIVTDPLYSFSKEAVYFVIACTGRLAVLGEICERGELMHRLAVRLCPYFCGMQKKG